MGKGGKVAFKILQRMLMLLLVFLLLCNIYVIMAKKITGSMTADVFGFSMAVVASGSMEPALSVNDVIIIKEQENYGEGDIITFAQGNSLVTHRILEKSQTGFITKGDANNVPDAKEVKMEDVVGKTVFVIPAAGKWIAYDRTPLGMMLLVFVGMLILGIPVMSNKKYKEGIENEK